MGNIKSIKRIGCGQTYDLELDHPDHQFYLSNGVLTSNSHAICYSFLSYQTAYLKAHYPLEFLTAYLRNKVTSNAPTAKEEVFRIKKEIRSLNVKISPPDINKSDHVYKIIDNSNLMTGFNGLKYMGKDAIPDLLEKRPFSSFEDLLLRIEGKKTRIPSVQALAASGCLDSFGYSRKQMFLYAKDYRDKLKAWEKRVTDKEFKYPWPEDVGEWALPEKYAMESFYIGEGLCCGIKEAYRGFFTPRALNFSRLPTLFPDTGDMRDRAPVPDAIGSIEGVVTSYFEFKVKNEKSAIFGETMAKMEIEDPYGNTSSITFFPSGIIKINKRIKELTRGKVKLETGIAIAIAGSINWYEGKPSFVFEDLKRCAPIPPKPADLKHKKVSLRVPRRKKTKKKKVDPNKILEQVESDLIFAGQ